MRFWSVLKAEAPSAEDVAVQVRAIEAELPKYREALERAEDQAVALRQRSLGGGRVKPAEIDEAEEAREQARLNLLALERSRDELRGKLLEAVAREREQERTRIAADLKALAEEEARARDELIDLAFTLIAKAMRVAPFQLDPSGRYPLGLGVWQHSFRHFLDRRLFRVASGRDEPTAEEWERFRAALEQEGVLAEAPPEVCLAVRRRALLQRQKALETTTVEEAAQALLGDREEGEDKEVDET